ncbi:hypothetical protein Tsp_03606 [Trichinella spiralis]|uniref:hypothetical protein n=1 Tax=Trichinella spiralis TaxID=6334 RepID=UPI0001EFB9FB|nr:hypothetical protein Tsp_03606 [Trichinella spiralis]
MALTFSSSLRPHDAIVILFTGLLSVRRVVNYISALQNEPGNSEFIFISMIK